jgi:hypothetical protein
VKKLRDDLVTKPPRDIPGKPAGDPGPKFDPLVTMRPGRLQPFAVATPHHAALGGEEYGAASPDVQLLEVDAAIAEAMAQAARAQADLASLQQTRDAIEATYGDGSFGNGEQ